MQTILKITLLTLCLALVSAEVPHTPLPHMGDFSLMRFMARSSDVSRQNPQRSVGCFDYYVPLLRSIAEEYETTYGICLDKAALDKSGVDESTHSERQLIEGTAENSCQLLSSCNIQADAVAFFQCYATAGSENTKTMYAISGNASEVLMKIREEYRLIDNSLYRCTNASDRAYVENTGAAYEGLQSCLEGRTPVPTTTTTTTTTTTMTESSTTTEESESQPEPESEAESEPESEPEDETEAGPEDESESESKSELEYESENESQNAGLDKLIQNSFFTDTLNR